MSTTFSVNGVSYSFPTSGENSWVTQVNSWAAAVSSGTLQKNGGSFALTAEVDFGFVYGIKTKYYKTAATTPATAGQFRLGNLEGIYWRNTLDTLDLGLGVDSSNNLAFNSVAVTLASNSAPTVVTFGYTSSAADTTTRYSAPGGPSAAAGTVEFAMRMPFACKVSNMYIYAVTAPAANCVYVARKNGVDTSITATMANAGTTAGDAVNTATFAVGDRLSVKHTMASNTTCAANATITFELTLV